MNVWHGWASIHMFRFLKNCHTVTDNDSQSYDDNVNHYNSCFISTSELVRLTKCSTLIH